jgi:2-oxoisovalerate dehydrogenase E1 component alpha subunit
MYHSKSYLKNVRVLLTRAVQDSVRIAYRAAFRAQVEKHHGRRIGNAYQQGCSGSYAAVGQQARCCSSGTERPVSWFSPGGEVHFPGAVAAPYTHKLVVEEAAKLLPIPAFRLLNNNGELVDGVDSKSVEERVSGAVLRKIYDCMVALNVMDSILFSAQRQGRISFYLTSFCEEAAIVASAAALDNHDEVFAQYREQGVLLWRGYTYDDFCQQCCSTRKEPARGHQMPVHYGRKDMHFHTISSTLATQIPHAVGAAYALKLDGKGIAACYFGEGAASEGDFHAAMNFASTLDCPVLFICRNNGYAISTPATEQFRGDGIARRACGYGMDAIRCDGNDALAVYVATNYARDRIVATSRPMLLELLTYRGGHHSTSDDSSQYRSLEEIDYFMRYADPIARLGRFLNVSPAEEQAMRERERTLVLDALSSAEQEEKEPPLDMFLDVYSSMPPHLIRQRESLRLSLERIEQAKANRASTSPK